jgi:hypothetical protein
MYSVLTRCLQPICTITWNSVQGLGLAAGPIQPINAELAVDVTYPCDETAVESVQHIGGNMVSALLIPVAEWASSRVDYEIFPGVPILASDIRGDVVLLLLIALITMAYYGTFNAPLARSLADSRSNNDESQVSGDDMIDIPVNVPHTTTHSA